MSIYIDADVFVAREKGDGGHEKSRDPRRMMAHTPAFSFDPRDAAHWLNR